MSAEFSRPTVTLGMRLSFQDEELGWSSVQSACLQARGSARGQILKALLIQHYLLAWLLPRRLALLARAAERPSPSGCDVAAQAATWAREMKPSLVKMCSTWFSAVRCAITSSAAICLLLRPAAISRATCSSRGVSGATGPGPARAGVPSAARADAWLGD